MAKRSVLCALVLVALACSDNHHSKAGDTTGPDGGANASGDGSGDGTAGDKGSSGSSGSSSGGGANGSGGSSGSKGGGALDDGGTNANGGDGGSVTGDAPKLCGGVACQCADGIDNDNDGTIDGFDVECTGANDNDEGSFSTGIPGDNVDPKWQDCFYDGNSGGGDDGCRYSTKCLTGELPQDDKNCTLSQSCIDFCMKRTPNGCDCFGCCTIGTKDGKSVDVMLEAKCDPNDLSTCTTCTKSADCANECAECELCPGKTAADLPASCTPPGGSGGTSGGGGGTSGGGGTGSGGATGSGGTTGGGTPYCANGTACASQSECPTNYYCSFGCCILASPD
jgi:hypothetical protein